MTVPLALDLGVLPTALAGGGPALLKRLALLDAEQAPNLEIYSPDPNVAEPAGGRLVPRLPDEAEIAACRVLFVAGLPRAEIMGGVGLLALAANVASVLLLMRYKDGDANVRSVWLCSRNDAIGNVAVMVAALGVWGTATGWPDLIVAGIMAGLFLNSSVQILWQGWGEWRRGAEPVSLAQSCCSVPHGPGHEGHQH